ncbi:hypothetical protein PR003_g11438 [Phytophthora rubi]|uniref:Uncharacterized protein n=1 Tax=Phytophthora rubi TaxID=129364 RepID=A0A6A4F312_9STRA|nr:hypothetical protein PR001_g15791 [Phytophthora rubi]KAE9338554.1 hypothetical protein PR003_g11438 [Phytophthora rubi]
MLREWYVPTSPDSDLVQNARFLQVLQLLLNQTPPRIQALLTIRRPNCFLIILGPLLLSAPLQVCMGFFFSETRRLHLSNLDVIRGHSGLGHGISGEASRSVLIQVFMCHATPSDLFILRHDMLRQSLDRP